VLFRPPPDRPAIHQLRGFALDIFSFRPFPQHATRRFSLEILVSSIALCWGPTDSYTPMPDLLFLPAQSKSFFALVIWISLVTLQCLSEAYGCEATIYCWPDGYIPKVAHFVFFAILRGQCSGSSIASVSVKAVVFMCPESRLRPRAITHVPSSYCDVPFYIIRITKTAATGAIISTSIYVDYTSSTCAEPNSICTDSTPPTYAKSNSTPSIYVNSTSSTCAEPQSTQPPRSRERPDPMPTHQPETLHWITDLLGSLAMCIARSKLNVRYPRSQSLGDPEQSRPVLTKDCVTSVLIAFE
jgi:hypothetical protein